MKQPHLILVRFLCLFVLSSLASAADPAGNTVVLKAARMFDGKGKALVTNAVVIVQAGKIVDAGSNLTIPPGAQVIDLGDATLVAGFHRRAYASDRDYSGNYNERRLKEFELNVSEQAYQCDHLRARDGRSRLHHRARRRQPNCRQQEFLDVALRNAINRRHRRPVRACSSRRTASARPADISMPSAGFRDVLFGREPDYSDGIADGPDEIRKAVRYEVKNGADVIKAAVSGGVLSLTDEVDAPQFTPAEMAALVDETHRLRKKVAVHCHGDQAARDAINAGVDSIEHGSFFKPETLQLMKSKGTYLMPTLDGDGMDSRQMDTIRRPCRRRRRPRRGALRDVSQRGEVRREDCIRN